MNQNNNEYIKTFLKIEKTEENSDPLFYIDKTQKKFSLYSPEKYKLDFEFDKIFIDSDVNSYVYEIICQNCIQEFIKGVNYSFISFGESINKKFEFLVGDVKENYTNINDYGILMRFLDELLTRKNEKDLNYVIKFSNFLVFENNLIDLTYFGGKNKKGYEIDSNLFLSNAHKINNDTNIINKMNKINLSRFNDIIKYLHYIHKFLSKLNKENIYNKSNICFIIYLFDEVSNKIVSTISFIILLGSENLHTKPKTSENIKSIKKAKSSIETRNIFNSIIDSISNNAFINKKNKSAKNDEKIVSKLTTVLNNICFDKNKSNIKFRIIGNIKPMKGYYQYTKDVLVFLFDCWKILNSKIEIVNKDKIENDQFSLEFKNKELNNEINILKKKIENLNKKIEFLDCNYQKQISVIKNCFGFDGDINVLLSGNEYTKEFKYVNAYKNCQYLINTYEETQKSLEKNLEESKNEITALKNKLNSKKEQQDMINYYCTAQKSALHSKKNSTEKEKYNYLSKQIEELSAQIKTKDKIIFSLQKELDKKSKILFNINIPDFKNKKKEKKENLATEFNFRKELENLKLKEEKEMEEIKDKYNSILIGKKQELSDLKYSLEKNTHYISEIKSELIKLYEIFMNFLSYINNNKTNFNKGIEELENVIKQINIKMSYKNFPNLFEELNQKNKIINIIDISKENLSINQNKTTDNSKDKIIEELKEKNKLICLSFDLQNKKNNNNLIIINSQKRTIEKLQKENNIFKEKLLKKKSLSNEALLLNKNLKKSFSFKYNDLLTSEKPFIIRRNKRMDDIYNYDSFRQQTKNTSNIINQFTSFQNTSEKNKDKNKNMKEFILIQKRINKNSKNKRPFSISNEMKNNFILTTK